MATRTQAFPYGCSEIRRAIPYAKSGTYNISLTGDGKSLIPVYCDMSGKNGWTKILQIAQPYDPQSAAFGDVSGSSFNKSGKLDDSVINRIADNLRQANFGSVPFRLTATDTSYSVYVINPKTFNDTKVAWNLFNGERKQCLSPDLGNCSWVDTSWQTLDTYHDGTKSGDSKHRFFTEHNGAGDRTAKCWNPKSIATTMC